VSAPSHPPGDAAQVAERLGEVLEQVLAALTRGDAEGARAAAQEAAEVGAAPAARGARLPPATVAALADACARAEKLAGGILGRVGGELSDAARSRRAADAYGAPTSPHRDLP
jgi:hypothetical protein